MKMHPCKLKSQWIEVHVNKLQEHNYPKPPLKRTPMYVFLEVFIINYITVHYSGT